MKYPSFKFALQLESDITSGQKIMFLATLKGEK